MFLFQFWDKVSPPSDVAAAMEKWRSIEGFEYWRHHLRSARSVVAEYGAAAAAAFDRCAFAEMQSDLFRYAALHRWGGVYVDADLAPRESAGDILGSVGSGGLMREQNGGEAGTDFLVFPQPGHPFLARLLELAVERVNEGLIPNLYLVTGPGLIRWTIQTQQPELMADIRILPIAEFEAAILYPPVEYKGPGKHWSHRMKNGQSIYTKVEAAGPDDPA